MVRQALRDGISRVAGAPALLAGVGLAALLLANLRALAAGALPPAGFTALVVVQVAVWTFLLGGILDRLARGRPVGAAAFWSACRIHCFRFGRLAAAGLVGWALCGLLPGWLLAALLLPANLLFDYVQIRMVVEDRRSVFGALLAAARFVRRRPGATLGLHLLIGLLLVPVLAACVFAAGGGERGWPTLLAGQACIVARAAVKLVFYAAQTAYFQSQLAHPGYVARPRPA